MHSLQFFNKKADTNHQPIASTAGTRELSSKDTVDLFLSLAGRETRILAHLLSAMPYITIKTIQKISSEFRRGDLFNQAELYLSGLLIEKLSTGYPERVYDFKDQDIRDMLLDANPLGNWMSVLRVAASEPEVLKEIPQLREILIDPNKHRGAVDPSKRLISKNVAHLLKRLGTLGSLDKPLHYADVVKK